jgi:hypothetical protein
MEQDKVVAGIRSVRDRIIGAWEDPVTLSDLGNKLATYNAYLGDHLGEVESKRETEKSKIYLEALKSGTATTGADNWSRAQVAELTGQARRLAIMHKDANVQISMIQSRLRVLENQMRNQV